MSGGPNYDNRPPGEGTWSVFAEKVVRQRDDALARVAELEAALRPVAAFPLPGGPGGDDVAIITRSVGDDTFAITIGDLRAARRALGLSDVRSGNRRRS